MELQEGQTLKTTSESEQGVPEDMAEFVSACVPLFGAEARAGPQVGNDVIKPLC